MRILFLALMVLIIAGCAATNPAQNSGTARMGLAEPEDGQSVPPEFIVSGWAYDTTASEGAGPGTELAQVYIGTECSGEKLTERGYRWVTGWVVAQDNLDESFLNAGFRFVVQDAPQGELTFSVCVHSVTSGEVIGKITRAVRVDEQAPGRSLFRIDRPEENAALSPPVLIRGPAFDTSPGGGNGPGIESARFYEGSSCAGEPFAETAPNQTDDWLTNFHFLDTSYLFNYYEIILQDIPLGEFEFTACAYSSVDGSIVGEARRKITIVSPEEDYTVQRRVISEGFRQPLLIANAADDSGRLFVGEQVGRIQVLIAGLMLNEPFLDISHLVPPESEAPQATVGLLDLAFHPDFKTNGYFFVSYIDADYQLVIARYHASVDAPNRADAESAEIVIRLPKARKIHPGGRLAFDANGYLHITLGDDDDLMAVLDGGKFAGKILRINVDQLPYSIPPDNPFVGQEAVTDEIVFTGLRSPWTISFDPETNDLYVIDVGEHTREELNFIPASYSGGRDFGWPRFEGMRPYELQGRHAAITGLKALLSEPASTDRFIFPAFEYLHDEKRCAAIGGAVYRGAALPELTGKYIYSDFCSGEIFAAYADDAGVWQQDVIGVVPGRITAIGRDENGEVYFADYQEGVLYQLVPAES